MRRWSATALVSLAFLAAALLAGCGQEEQRAGRQQPEGQPSGRGGSPTTDEQPEPAGLGETAGVGPFSVTLNGAVRESADGGRFAVVDLTLENGGEGTADASGADYLLRDAEGYSFETGTAPGQRPRPEGQVEPGGKASGQVAFELGEEPADGRLELSVSLPDEEGAARFSFEAEQAEAPEPKPEPEPDTARQGDGPSVRPGYRLLEDPSGSLSVEAPSSWSSETGADSEGGGGENSWSYYAGEYLTASITTAGSLEAWYGSTGSGLGSGAYLVASESLAQRYTDEELIYDLFYEEAQEDCVEGPTQEIDRPPLSGKVQVWFDCNGLDNVRYNFAAAPEGRPCVVVGGARIVPGAPEADREAVAHIVESFEVDCGSLPPPEPLPSEETPPASATATASPDASVEPQDSPCEEVQDRLNAGDDSLTSAELLACDLSPEAINPCEGNPDPSCAESLPEGAYPSIGGPDGVGTNNECSDLPRGSPEAVECYENLIGAASSSASASASP